MVSAIRLSDYSITPLYNIKAVVQATNISPSTLRAWERRYNMCQPQRTDSGYRLYSDRDIAIIRWLKAQVDAGMSISQAVSWLQNLTQEGNGDRVPTLLDPTGRALESMALAAPSRHEVQSFRNLQGELLEVLLGYDELAADEVLARAFALYPLEQVGDHLIMPVLVEIGEQWQRGKVSVTSEHYATNYLIQRLAALLRAVPNGTHGPIVWIGCAPGEFHEMGALLLAIYLRRAGYQIRYFGSNLAEEDLVAEVRNRQPDMLLFSATTLDAAQSLGLLCDMLAQEDPPRPLIGFGGRAFNLYAELRDEIAGTFLGTTALDAVETIGQRLAQRPAPSRGRSS